VHGIIYAQNYGTSQGKIARANNENSRIRTLILMVLRKYLLNFNTNFRYFSFDKMERHLKKFQSEGDIRLVMLNQRVKNLI